MSRNIETTTVRLCKTKESLKIYLNQGLRNGAKVLKGSLLSILKGRYLERKVVSLNVVADS